MRAAPPPPVLAGARLRSASPRCARFALALALFAGLRVLAFGLAFPFFTNVDEYRHVDAVLKYARGELPRPGPDAYEPETARLIGSLGSPEYHRDPVAPLRSELPRPAWEVSEAEVERRIASGAALLAGRHSLEADQPPVYYAVAGAWLALGRGLGLRDAPLWYWVRGLGAAAAFGLVLLAWWGLREPYAERPAVRLGVPILLAAFPQDALFYVTSDALTPLLGGAAFVWVVRLSARPESRPWAFAGAGLVLAAAFLCKYPNAALYAAAGVACLAALAGGRAPGGASRWALYWGAALLPAGLWLARNAWLGGDWLGTAFKVERLGWGRQPASEWLDHPLFTPSGAWTFVRDLVPSFWRGELVWQKSELHLRGADAVYRFATLLLLPLAGLAWLRGEGSREARTAEAAAGVAVAAAVATLALLSLVFDFPSDSSPSADYPFFVQGRLVAGVTLPFCLLFARGIEAAGGTLPGRWRDTGRFALLLAVVAVAIGSELAVSGPVFASPYNWFHLP
jgi:hypothetical protein